MHCVSDSTLSLIWNGKRRNGKKLPNFSPIVGLMQGDSLSHLFVLCMEKLCLTISEVVQNNYWKHVQVSKNGPRFSHLFFANDVLLFSKTTCNQGRLIGDIFNKFSSASGLKINCSKPHASFFTGVPRSKVVQITNLSCICSTHSLEKYLGFPMIIGKVKKEDFNFILDKLNAKLASWKNKLLNKHGRLALATSVINSIPTYYMQISSNFKSKYVLKGGYCYCIGDDNSLFWYAPWLCNNPFCCRVDYIAIHDTHIRIKDVYYVDG